MQEKLILTSAWSLQLLLTCARVGTMSALGRKYDRFGVPEPLAGMRSKPSVARFWCGKLRRVGIRFQEFFGLRDVRIVAAIAVSHFRNSSIGQASDHQVD